MLVSTEIVRTLAVLTIGEKRRDLANHRSGPDKRTSRDLAPLFRRTTLGLRVNRFSNGSFVDNLINVIYLSE
jgi:hypothetical protein